MRDVDKTPARHMLSLEPNIPMTPSEKQLKPEEYSFRDDGIIPNNPRLSTLLYRKARGADSPEELAEAFEYVFAKNDWVDSWRNGVYPYHHYHSVTHEVLAVYRGRATLALGGAEGQSFAVTAGDVLVLPAGVGHKRVDASGDFAVVGAYPKGSDFNLIRGEVPDRDQIDEEIAAVPIPATDPLFGPQGPLRQIWVTGATA